MKWHGLWDQLGSRPPGIGEYMAAAPPESMFQVREKQHRKQAQTHDHTEERNVF